MQCSGLNKMVAQGSGLASPLVSWTSVSCLQQLRAKLIAKFLDELFVAIVRGGFWSPISVPRVPAKVLVLCVCSQLFCEPP